MNTLASRCPLQPRSPDTAFKRVDDSHSEGILPLKISFEDERGNVAPDQIRVVIGQRGERDRDNAVEAWPEHGLLGTQLGPNKNGKKW